MNCGDIKDTVCAPPDVCANVEDSKEQHLMSQRTDENDPYLLRVLKRDKVLLAAIAIMVLLLNIPRLSFILYPFKIFSTWAHEMCHGMAAIFMNGPSGFGKLHVYKDGSGVAYTSWCNKTWKNVVVSSAGYPGSALVGSFLLLWRRTRRGPTVGLIGMGIAMLLSVAFFVRNQFGIIFVSLMGAALIVIGWQFKARWIGYLYSFLAATCSFNAVESIHDLFGMTQGYVNGEVMPSDASTVADYTGVSARFWATSWFVLSLVASGLAIIFARDGLTYRQDQRERQQELQNYYYAHDYKQSQQPAKQTEIPVAVAVY